MICFPHDAATQQSVDYGACKDQDTGTAEENTTKEPKEGQENLKYKLEDTPPIHVTAILGLQNFMIMFMTQVTSAFLMAEVLCMKKDILGQANIISTMIFVSGIITLLQSLFGSRLPIIQGSSTAYLSVVLSVLSLSECPRETISQSENFTTTAAMISTTPESKGNAVTWHIRMRDLQGSLMVSSVVEIFLGFTGLLGILTKYISSLTIGIVISLIGLPLIPVAMRNCGASWPIASGTVALIILFSQYLKYVEVPFPAINSKFKCYIARYPVFLVFSLILAMIPMWILCLILTASGALSNSPGTWQYNSRTDTKAHVLYDSPWVRFPYPLQWGLPTISLPTTLGMLAAIIASSLESIGDYHACARLAQVPPPPTHAINRGLGTEGLGVFLCGLFGTGLGSTSYSNNIAILTITKAASRRIAYAAAAWMILLGLFSKFGALFASMPGPIVGATFLFSVCIIVSAGISTLHLVDTQSSRNMAVIGFSLGLGMGIPGWINENPTAISTGSTTADQVLLVLLRTPMLLGGVAAFFLDITLPKSEKDQAHMKALQDQKTERDVKSLGSYDFPIGMTCLRKHTWTSKIPFCPTFRGFRKKNTEVTITKL